MILKFNFTAKNTCPSSLMLILISHRVLLHKLHLISNHTIQIWLTDYYQLQKLYAKFSLKISCFKTVRGSQLHKLHLFFNHCSRFGGCEPTQLQKLHLNLNDIIQIWVTGQDQLQKLNANLFNVSSFEKGWVFPQMVHYLILRIPLFVSVTYLDLWFNLKNTKCYGFRNFLYKVTTILLGYGLLKFWGPSRFFVQNWGILTILSLARESISSQIPKRS
jgi:hypothetical protein